MGANLSNQFTQNTLNSLTSVINDTVSTVVQNLNTTCTSTNTFEGNYGIYPTRVLPGGEVDTAPCPTNINSVSISQNANNTCSITGGITNSVQENLTSTLSTNINNWITQNQTQNNGWLGIGINIAASEGINQDNLSQRIANTLTSNVAQTCSAFLDASNIAKVYVCGNYPNGIIVVQNAASTNLTSCIINNTVTAITNDTVLNNIVNRTSQQTSQTNEGIFSGLKWIIIAVVIVVVLAIIGVALYFIFGSKSTPPQAGVQSKEQEKLMLERELIEKRQGINRRPGDISVRTPVLADETAKEAFERHDLATSPSRLDRFKSLAREYGSRAAAYAE